MVSVSESSQIINSHSTKVSIPIISINRHRNETTILSLIIKLRGPIVGQIFLHITGTAVSSTSIGICHIGAETTTTSNSMDMRGWYDSGTDNWIYALVNEAAVTLDNECGACGGDERS